MWKALNHSIWINESKVMRIISLGVFMNFLLQNKLWSPLFNSIFNIFEKKKALGVGCLLQHYNHWDWHFFNSISKFLTILCFESFSTSFYLLFFSYMLYNSKWSKIFKHVANLPWIRNPKSNHHFGHFFTQMWPCEVLLPIFSQCKC